jgi:hypothetical protein
MNLRSKYRQDYRRALLRFCNSSQNPTTKTRVRSALSHLRAQRSIAQYGVSVPAFRRLCDGHQTVAEQTESFPATLTAVPRLRHRDAMDTRYGTRSRGNFREEAMPAPAKTADTAASARLATYSKNACPQCGGWLLAPDWSEYLGDRCVRHTWSCEACDYQFETAVFFAQAA